MELVDEAERAVAQLATRLLVERMDVAARDLHEAGRRAIEAAENLEQRGLAGAGRPDDRQPFAGTHVEVHALQHLQVDGPLAERTLDVLRFQYFIHDEGPPPAACARPATRGR